MLPFCFVAGVSLKNNKHGINITLHKYKNIEIGTNNTRLLPPILIIPVLIENSDNESIISNRFNENKTFTLQLVHKNNINNEDNDINVGFRQSLNKGMGPYKKSTEDSKSEIKVRQIGNEIENKTVIANSTEQNIIIENIKNTTEVEKSTMLPEGLYPASNNSNIDTNSISLTTTTPDANLPPITDNRWQNFTVSTTLNFMNESTTKEPDSSTYSGPYSAALYNNGMIDQISITTNSYTNEESPLPSPKNERWRTFSQKTQYSANQFKPLAGLYYDGFLHKPLIMLPGFIPRNYYNVY